MNSLAALQLARVVADVASVGIAVTASGAIAKALRPLPRHPHERKFRRISIHTHTRHKEKNGLYNNSTVEGN